MTREEAKIYFKQCNSRIISVCKDENKYDYEKQEIISNCARRTYEANRLAIQALEQEPSWIPVSERLPEEHEWIGTKTFGTTISDNVFVTLEATNGKRFTDYTRLQNGKLSLSKQAEWDAISKGIKLIAWMPSPEPYKAESEE